MRQAKRVCLVTLLTSLVIAVTLDGATARDPDVRPAPESITIGDGDSERKKETDDDDAVTDPVVTDSPVGDDGSQKVVNDPTDDARIAKCEQSQDLNEPMPVCDFPDPPEPEEGEEVAEVTPGMVLEVFRRIPLPESELQVQPPEGETLVNFETNFYTEAEGFGVSLILLGQQVDLRIWPSSYAWVYGDGVGESGTNPGAPYPDLQVTHVYLDKGRVGPRVDTTWSAVWRVSGGPWQPMNGTVTMTGTPVPLRVLEAQPNLVASGG